MRYYIRNGYNVILFKNGYYYRLNGVWCGLDYVVLRDAVVLGDVYTLVFDEFLSIACGAYGSVNYDDSVDVYGDFDGVVVGIKVDDFGVRFARDCSMVTWWGGLVRWCDFVSVEGLL